jgi:hypothetical protein
MSLLQGGMGISWGGQGNSMEGVVEPLLGCLKGGGEEAVVLGCRLTGSRGLAGKGADQGGEPADDLGMG